MTSQEMRAAARAFTDSIQRCMDACLILFSKYLDQESQQQGNEMQKEKCYTVLNSQSVSSSSPQNPSKALNASRTLQLRERLFLNKLGSNQRKLMSSDVTKVLVKWNENVVLVCLFGGNRTNRNASRTLQLREKWNERAVLCVLLEWISFRDGVT